MALLIDSHCHLDFPAFDADRTTVLEQAVAGGVAAIIVPGVEAASWPRLLDLCRHTPCLHPAPGLHPLLTAQHGDDALDRLERLLAEQPVVAIGEIGLDFYPDGVDRERQIALFEAQLAIARDADLPVLLHVRKAHDEVLKRLRRAGLRGGIAHAFNGSLQQAQQYIELGFLLGFGGAATFPQARRLRHLLCQLPSEALALESDAPDMPPAWLHGARNSPAELPRLCTELAALRGEPAARLAAASSDNVSRLLGITACTTTEPATDGIITA